MRPRHRAAENLADHTGILDAAPASMRPRHRAAENATTARNDDVHHHSFNEAAA